MANVWRSLVNTVQGRIYTSVLVDENDHSQDPVAGPDQAVIDFFEANAPDRIADRYDAGSPTLLRAATAEEELAALQGTRAASELLEPLMERSSYRLLLRTVAQINVDIRGGDPDDQELVAAEISKLEFAMSDQCRLMLDEAGIEI